MIEQRKTPWIGDTTNLAVGREANRARQTTELATISMKINKHLTFAALTARTVTPLFRTQITLAGVLALLGLPARADTFGTGTNMFGMNSVEISNPGNGDDAGGGGGTYSGARGGVDYIYRISVTEVPQDWIEKATRLGLTHVTAGAWKGSQPAANMTWHEAAAFVNWLNTISGHHAAYDLTYSNSWSMKLWSKEEAWQAGGQNLYRHKDAHYFFRARTSSTKRLSTRMTG